MDFTFDAAGQLSLTDHSANDSAELSYDGRGFLRYGSVGAFTELAPTYSSDGLLYSLLRDWSPLTPHERHNVLYFAGRPIAIWKKVGTNTATLVRIVTDHLGTPAASIQEAGSAVDWYGGFMPFGEDWQAGTGQDSLSKGIFLRMPGQWKDSIWSTSSSPLELLYNVHRWYEPQTGRYISVDPLSDLTLETYGYVGAGPLLRIDPWGLAEECIGLCWRNSPRLEGGLAVTLIHKLAAGPANELVFDIKCPEGYGSLRNIGLCSTGEPPRSPTEHPFPDGWDTSSSRIGGRGGFQVRVSVPSRTFLSDRASLRNVRVSGECCCEE